MYIIHLCITTLLVLEITAKPDSRIIGGSDVFPTHYRYAAAIDVQTAAGKFFCCGALVRTRWILTSGHCVYNATLFTIRLGSLSLTADDANRQTFTSSKYVLHPDFDPESFQADLGLIRLNATAEQSDSVRSALLYKVPIGDGITARALGWGQISDSDSALSEKLLYAEVVTLNNDECKVIYGNQITNDTICAKGKNNEGTCTGDTGGPLVLHAAGTYMVIGVASFISANGCESTNPSGFTRIAPYYDWMICTMTG